MNDDGMITEADRVLDAFADELRKELGQQAWSAWGAGLRVAEADGVLVNVYAPSSLHCERLSEEVGPRKLKAMWQKVDPRNRALRLEPEPRAAATAEALGDGLARPAPANDAPDGVAKRSSLSRTFDSFVVGHANKVAHAAARAIAADGEPPFRLAVVHGPYGCGKSHLLSSVAADAHGREVLYFNADRFRAEYVKSLKASTGLEFKDRVRAADILLIDDLHLLGGSKSTQTELYHAINDVLSEGGRVLVAADRPVDDLTELDPRLRSRLSGAVGCPIERPDLDLRRRILEGMSANNPFVKRGLEIPTEVLDFLASAVTALPRDLEAALATVITRTALIGLPVTRETAREALSEMLAGTNRRVTVEDIQKAVASYHGMQLTALLSKRRTRDIVRPRQEAMYLCKEFTTRSLPDIARRFGGMDHTTVMHACKRVKDLMKMDPTVRSDIDALRRILTEQREQPSA